MTEQLMDDLTNEEHEALLLMSEHAIAPPLSLAAQAVLDAAFPVYDEEEHLYIATGEQHAGMIAAAALRAAANQIAYLPQMPSDYDINVQDGREEIREQLIAIASELKNTNG